MTLGALSLLLKRAKHIYRTEGLIALLRRGLLYVVRCFFVCESHYLLVVELANYQVVNRPNLTPKVNNITSQVVTTNQEVDELEAQGFEFRSHIWNARERLNNGAIAVCTFVGTELATISWVALTERAKASLIGFPIEVNFDKGEVLGAGALTIPKYRGMGLMGYNSAKRYEFLANIEIIRSIGTVDKKNIFSQKAEAKAGAKSYGEARYLRILWWRFWKEKPLVQTTAQTEITTKISR